MKIFLLSLTTLSALCLGDTDSYISYAKEYSENNKCEFYFDLWKQSQKQVRDISSVQSLITHEKEESRQKLQNCLSHPLEVKVNHTKWNKKCPEPFKRWIAQVYEYDINKEEKKSYQERQTQLEKKLANQCSSYKEQMAELKSSFTTDRDIAEYETKTEPQPEPRLLIRDISSFDQAPEEPSLGGY